jgi:RsiW-degrading membrane proteinase PrsW (M82 family)
MVAPAMAVGFYAFMKYRFPKGYFGLLFRSYFWGVFSTLIGALFFYFAYKFDYLDLKNLRRILFYSFFIIGFGQEFSKFLVLRFLMLPSKYFKNPSDGISYSIMISLGSVSLINLAYFILEPDVEYNYLISNVLVGLVYAVVLGFFVGMGKIRNNRMIDSLSGLAGAAFFHGSFEFILKTNDMLLIWPFLVGSAIITFLLIVKSIQISDEVSS